jgi:hypothetical protein
VRAQQLLIAMFGTIAVCVLIGMIVPVCSAPITPTEPRKTLIHFPARSVGRIIFVTDIPGKVGYDSATAPHSIEAKGDVQLSTDRPIGFVLNYDGAANSSFLDSPEMIATNLLQIDMRNVESANDDTLKHFTHLTRIRRLLFSGTDLTDAGLKYLASLKELSHITASGTLMKGSGLAYLAELPGLERLELSRSNFRDCKFEKIPTFKKLKMFTASQSLLNDGACEFIGRQHLLEELDISKNKITDAGIARLAGLKKLRTLNLCDTLVTPKCLASLSKMPSLLSLTLILGQLPPTSVTMMQKALPKCHFELTPTDSRIDSSLFSPLR